MERRRLRCARGWCRGRPHLQGECRAGRRALDVDAGLRSPRGPHPDARLCGDARGRDGGVRQKLAAELATSILPSLNGKTKRSWRGIVPFTHLAREGRMTVTIGRRELLAALGGAAAVWPLAAGAQQQALPVIGFLGGTSPDTFADRVRAFRQGLKDTGYVE